MYEERGREREREHLSRARANTRVLHILSSLSFWVTSHKKIFVVKICTHFVRDIIDCFRLALKESQLREPRGRRCRSTNFLGTLGRLGLRFFASRATTRGVVWTIRIWMRFALGTMMTRRFGRICAWHPSRRRTARGAGSARKRSVKAHRESVCRTSGADRISAT